MTPIPIALLIYKACPSNWLPESTIQPSDCGVKKEIDKAPAHPNAGIVRGRNHLRIDSADALAGMGLAA
jgi:hypothetical protein